MTVFVQENEKFSELSFQKMIHDRGLSLIQSLTLDKMLAIVDEIERAFFKMDFHQWANITIPLENV